MLWVRFEPSLLSLLSSKKFHESVLEGSSPEPVYGQRQCRVGRLLGDQRCDTPDQSAARSTTLGHLLSKGVTKGKGAVGKQRSKPKRGGVRAVLEILDQSTARKTRHNTRGKRRKGGGEKRQPKDRTETNRGAKEQGPKIRKKGDAPPTDVRRKTRTKKGQNRSELK